MHLQALLSSHSHSTPSCVAHIPTGDRALILCPESSISDGEMARPRRSLSHASASSRAQPALRATHPFALRLRPRLLPLQVILTLCSRISNVSRSSIHCLSVACCRCTQDGCRNASGVPISSIVIRRAVIRSACMARARASCAAGAARECRIAFERPPAPNTASAHARCDERRQDVQSCTHAYGLAAATKRASSWSALGPA